MQIELTFVYCGDNYWRPFKVPHLFFCGTQRKNKYPVIKEQGWSYVNSSYIVEVYEDNYRRNILWKSKFCQNCFTYVFVQIIQKIGQGECLFRTLDSIKYYCYKIHKICPFLYFQKRYNTLCKQMIAFQKLSWKTISLVYINNLNSLRHHENLKCRQIGATCGPRIFLQNCFPNHFLSVFISHPFAPLTQLPPYFFAIFFFVFSL